MRHTTTIILLILGLATGWASAGLAGHGSGGPEGSVDPLAARKAKRAAVSVAGHAAGLTPGLSTGVRLTVTNRFGFAVKVRSIRVLVGDAPGCPAANLIAGSYKGRLRVKAHGKGIARTRLMLKPVSTDACQGARFPLRYLARVSR